jgi:hypothetical protein
MNPDRHIAPTGPSGAPSIHYLRRHEIDIIRWDACIDNALNRLIYGHSFYLDAMAAGQWDALVLGDYLAVMPLPWRSRAGIRYLYQPPFTQQTGIFSVQPVTTDTVDAFLQQLTRHFRFAEIFLNYGNQHTALTPHANYILPLDSPYESLAGKYKDNLIRNLKKTAGADLNYVKDFDLKISLQDYRHEYAHRNPHLKEKNYRDLEDLCLLLQRQNLLMTRAVVGPGQEVLSSAVLFRDTNRFYLLQFTTLPAGRLVNSSHFLLDRFIREWAGTPWILDFEGSDAIGLGRFYSSFGGIDQPYFFYRYNYLPWPLRWLK